MQFPPDAAGIIVIVLDADRAMLLANRKGREVLGHGEDDGGEHPGIEASPPEHTVTDTNRTPLQLGAMDSEGDDFREIPIPANGGRQRTIRLLRSIVCGARDLPGGPIASDKDIAEENRLREREDRVQRALKARTAELEEVSRELDNFSYSVSHNLRAPLRAIDGYSRMILRNEAHTLDEDTRQQFTAIRCNAQMMGQLIDDLLFFSCLTRRNIVLSRIDMNDLVRDVWNELEILNPERTIELDLKDLPPCRGDQLLIRQVCFNLLSNAVKFTKFRKTARVEVGGHSRRNEIEYYIKDNGIGLDMAYHEQLFGVFQRLHGAEDYEGTGIGLAVVQRIVHRHGGRTWAEGKPDLGACFHFTLPGKE